MPIFEYECIDCGEHTEHLQLSSGSPLSECPKCGGEVRKLLSAPAFQFKGTGWYVTDYADKGKPSAGGDGAKGGSGGKSGADSGSGSDSSSESKASSSSSDSSGSTSSAKSTSKAGSSSSSD